MPRDLFGTVTDPSITLGSRKWYTVPLSLIVHTLVVLGVVVVPLLATGTLPVPKSGVVFVPVISAPVPPPPAMPRAQNVRQPVTSLDAAPVETPDSITKETSLQPGFEEGVAGATGLDGIGIVFGKEALPEPPPPPPAQPTKVRAGGDIRRPEKIHDIAPVYPPVAQAARIEGVVIIEATIGVDGRVQDAHVLRSAPLLDEAALAAVRQWIYTPTRLNGLPVSVVMTVTVRFQLQR